MIIALPRDTIMPISPPASAPWMAEASATRHAMFDTGTSLHTSHVKMVQTG